jgi:hypothetical protein
MLKGYFLLIDDSNSVYTNCQWCHIPPNPATHVTGPVCNPHPNPITAARPHPSWMFVRTHSQCIHIHSRTDIYFELTTFITLYVSHFYPLLSH